MTAEHLANKSAPVAPCSATTSCNISAAGRGPAKLDLCTRQGLVGGTSTNEAAPSNSCQVAGDVTQQCGSDMYCNSKTTSNICKCTAGEDECGLYGTCAPTPCKQCSTCITQLQDFVASQVAATNATAANVADAFNTYCNANLGSLEVTTATCSAVADAIRKTANTGRRAGSLCSLLGKRWLGVCVSSGCFLQPKGQ